MEKETRDKLVQIQAMTDTLTKFITYIGKVLPDDTFRKLVELRKLEVNPMASLIYDTIFENQELALKLDRPSCQNTGVIQFYARVGSRFHLTDELPEIFHNAVLEVTKKAPLRHNTVETFDEYNTVLNTGYRIPDIDWEIVPGSDELYLNVYMAGGGCTLPGKAIVLMPGTGYEGVAESVLDVMTSYGLDACPPLLVGVGVANEVEMAEKLSKRALMRPLDSRNSNEKTAMMEQELEEAIDALGLGPQGLSGARPVMGVHIENAARFSSAIGVVVSTGCWSHRRGTIVFKQDLTYSIITHKDAKL